MKTNLVFSFLSCLVKFPSSETQGQIVGARESLNGRKNMARRKVKNGEKSPWEQCLTRPVPNGRRCFYFWLVPENFCVFLPNQKSERRRPFGTGLVRHCTQGLFSPFFTFLRAIFFRPFRLSLAPTIYTWVSEDRMLSFRHAKLTTGREERVRVLAIECVSFFLFFPLPTVLAFFSRSNACIHTNKDGAKTRGKAERRERAVRFTRFLDCRLTRAVHLVPIMIWSVHSIN